MVKYVLKRRKAQRHLRMHFSDKGELIVSAPQRSSIQEIERFVERNKMWIEQIKHNFRQHSFLTGDVVRFLGQDYVLDVKRGSTRTIFLSNGYFFITTKAPPQTREVKKIFICYCKNKLLEIVKERTAYWVEKMQIKKPVVQVGNAKGRWGVCYPTKSLVRFSVIAITLPKDLIDLVVVHELCHFFYQNHSKDFKNELVKWMPDYLVKEKRFKELDKAGYHRNLF